MADLDNDYQVIRLSISWGMFSIAAFVGVLTLQVFGPQLGVNLIQVIGGTMALSMGGFAAGLIGLKFGNNRGGAKVGAFLNGVVLLCLFIILPAFQVLSRLG